MKKEKESSLIKIMSEKEIKEEFLLNISKATKNLFKILDEFRYKNSLPKRETSFALMKEANEIETFLDEFGASQNKNFFYFRELIASVRWFNLFLFQGLHLYVRLKHYKLEIDEKEYIKFRDNLRKNIYIGYKIIKKIAEEIFKEGENLGIKISKSKFSSEYLFPQIQKKILPPDLGEETKKEKKERIFEILIKYLTTSEEFNFFICFNPKEEYFKEEPIEKYRSLFEQLESLYDTYIKNTLFEIEHSELKKIRGHIAVCFHLLEIAKALVHFYERHIEKIKDLQTTKNLENIVDGKKIQTIIENFLLPYALQFSIKGKIICEKIFNETGRKPQEFIIETKVLKIPSHRLEDFHIRPIMPITQIANKYELDTFLYFNRKRYNLKSALEMAIAIPDIREILAKENVKIVIQGPKIAIEDIVNFLREKTGATEEKSSCPVIIS